MVTSFFKLHPLATRTLHFFIKLLNTDFTNYPL